MTRGRLKAGEWLLAFKPSNCGKESALPLLRPKSDTARLPLAQVTGAGGGMGSMAVELGKAVGAKVGGPAREWQSLTQFEESRTYMIL